MEKLQIVLVVAIPIGILLLLFLLTKTGALPKRVKGLIYFSLGCGLAYIFRHDPTEGPIFVCVGFGLGIIGIYLFAEGLKQDIVEEIRNVDSRQNQLVDRVTDTEVGPDE